MIRRPSNSTRFPLHDALPISSSSRRALLVVAICQSPLESRNSSRRQSSLAKPLRLGVGSALSSAMTNFVFWDAARVCLMDEVECIAQELQDWEGFVPFYFPGQAQGYPGITSRRCRPSMPVERRPLDLTHPGLIGALAPRSSAAEFLRPPNA